jgi:LPXTG-motif cell wall-anchored protein
MNKKSISALVVMGLISVIIFTAGPVSACHYEVGTYENDYASTKNSFFKGETVYVMGNAYGYNYPLKLRINDPSCNVVYYSDESKYVVYGSFFLNETSPVGIWSVQLGVYYCGYWHWSTSSGRIAYCSVTDANFVLTVNVDGNGSVIVDPDLNYYSFGSNVNLSAVSDSGWSFSHWSGDITSSSNPETIIMNSNKSVTAHFIQNQYILDVNIIGNGSVVKEPDKTFYVYGDMVNLSCFPESGWAFDHWEGDITGNDNPAFVTIDGNKNVTAVFVESLYTLTVNIEGDGVVDVNPSGPYSYGDIVSLNATANIGSIFSHWSGDFESVNASETIVMDSSKTVTAHFVQENFTLIINIVGSGSVNKTPDLENYSYNTSVELSAIAASGWIFNHWSGDLSGNLNPVIISITEDKNITAHFIQSNQGGGGSNNGGGGSGGNGGSTRQSTNLHPFANLSAGEPYIGFIDEKIEFNGSLSFDPDGHIVKYEWIFGDGTTGDGEVTTHVYSAPGDYEVELKVTDNDRASNTSKTIAVIVVPNRAPSEPVIIGPSEGKVNVNYSFSVFSTDDDSDDIKYTIDWGDGSISESEYILSGALFNTSHIWLKPGEYKILIKADDGKTNNTDDLTIIIYDDEPAPESDNFLLILLGLLALILLLILLYLAKRNKDKEKAKAKKKKKK